MDLLTRSGAVEFQGIWQAHAPASGTACLLALPAPGGGEPLATAVVGREEDATQRDQPPGEQGIDQHRDQGGQFKDTAGAQSLVMKDAVKGGHKHMTEVVQELHKAIVLAGTQETERRAQGQDHFQ